MRKVSVIITFIDGSASFFAEAIESVLSQSYGALEVLLVNDGARGECRDLALRFERRHPDRIRVLAFDGEINRGLSAARNLGIRHSDGDYVAFLDADDIWLPGKLAEQVSLLEANPQAGMLYGNTLYWHSWTGRPDDVGRDFIPRLGLQPNRVVPPPQLLAGFLSGELAVPCTCSIILRREILHRVGGFDEEFPGMYEDQVLYAKVSLATSIYVADSCWDWYRQHPASMTATAASNYDEAAARSQYLDWVESYLREKSVANKEVWRALRAERRIARLPAALGRRLKQGRKLSWRAAAWARGLG